MKEHEAAIGCATASDSEYSGCISVKGRDIPILQQEMAAIGRDW
jgi:hypothetical protein